jgi:uncharacterized protein (DUF305 family)
MNLILKNMVSLRCKIVVGSVLQNMGANITVVELGEVQTPKELSHHESAIGMSRSELSYGKDKKLKEIVQKDITDQTKEINEFKSWKLSHK